MEVNKGAIFNHNCQKLSPDAMLNQKGKISSINKLKEVSWTFS